MLEVQYVEGNEELLGEVRALWEELNRHHRARSKYFVARYENRTFDDRKADLIRKTRAGVLRVDLAKNTDINRTVGYCICSVSSNKVGEVDSIYVDPGYRKLGIGDSLMARALAWMDSHGVNRKVISVAGGNEEVFSFYGRYGFYPREIILERC